MSTGAGPVTPSLNKAWPMKRTHPASHAGLRARTSPLALAPNRAGEAGHRTPGSAPTHLSRGGRERPALLPAQPSGRARHRARRLRLCGAARVRNATPVSRAAGRRGYALGYDALDLSHTSSRARSPNNCIVWCTSEHSTFPTTAERWAVGRKERGKGKRSTRRGRKTVNHGGPTSLACRLGSDLTNTIRARGHRGLHHEAGHTTVPDQTATNSVPKSRLPTRGRPHT